MAKSKKVSEHRTNLKKNKFWRYFIWIFLGLIAVLIIAVFVLALLFNTKFYPKTRVAGVAVNSMTEVEALKTLKQKITDFQKQTLTIAVDKKQENLKVADLGLVYQPEETLQQLFKLGHPESFKDIFLQMPQIIKLLLFQQNMPLKVEMTKPDKLETLRTKLSTVPKPATFYLDNNQLKIKDEENGFGVSEVDLKDQTIQAVSFLKTQVPFKGQILKPQITKDVLTKIQPKVENILNLAPIKLLDSKGKDVYELPTGDILKLIDFSVSSFGVVGLKISAAGKQEIYPQIKEVVDQAGKPLKLDRNVDGGLTVLQKDTEGQTLDEDDLTQKLSNFLVDPKDGDITLVFSKSLNQVNINNYTKFNFKDLLGAATTTFYGSSNDRLTNIQVASATLNGQIINKDVTFSLGASLGEVTAATGYKSGWVITGDTIDSEIGGGLCQIATTMFRTALNTGMPIEERHNHGYRVEYYEPPVGMDAAIYYPEVDLKFKNNFGVPILIQTIVQGYTATFYIYGKSDGRKIEISTPVIDNIVAAPTDPKYIDDATLPKGTDVVLDSAHEGADTSFSYKVSIGAKIINEQTFDSHYVPWPEFIRRGTGG
jgi:vancomycin resistance protein YoaR